MLNVLKAGERTLFKYIYITKKINMTAILVDDEENNLRNLEALLTKHCPEIKIIAKCNDAFDAKSKIELLKPSIVFLDINMPKVNGIELLKMYINNVGEETKTIIITAYEEYAVDALKTGALAYILKPIDKTELMAAVKRASEYFEIRKLGEKTAAPKQQTEEDGKIIVNHEDGYVVLSYDDIIKIEAENTYSRIFDTHKKKYLSSKTLKHYEETLPENKFMRIHKSYIVNLDHVTGLGKSDNLKAVYLSHHLEALVAKDKKALLKKALKG
jgi:two-component system LytT family response regulator